MPDHHFVTLGAFPFKATAVHIGAKPRTVNVSANALSSWIVQTTDFVSGYRPIAIEGYLQGIDTQGESAAAHLVRLRTNLKTEVQKDTNVLTFDWYGLGQTESYAVYKNEDFPIEFDISVQETHRIYFTMNLSCLP